METSPGEGVLCNCDAGASLVRNSPLPLCWGFLGGCRLQLRCPVLNFSPQFLLPPPCEVRRYCPIAAAAGRPACGVVCPFGPPASVVLLRPPVALSSGAVCVARLPLLWPPVVRPVVAACLAPAPLNWTTAPRLCSLDRISTAGPAPALCGRQLPTGYRAGPTFPRKGRSPGPQCVNRV